ncbi:MAG: heparinase II/III family protein [Rhodospirillales bacterium]|nr:heparinase II/III family protein [Rhodospirillales bacterium]
MRVSQKVREALFSSPLYQLTLRGRTPKELRRSLTDPWTGNAQAGAALRRGEFSIEGKLIYLGENPWQGQSLDEISHQGLDSFGWLRNLREMGTEEAALRARQLIVLWIHQNRVWSDLPWQPHVLGARITNWMLNYRFLTGRADEAFLAEFLASIVKQSRHLPRAAGMALQDEKVFPAIRGLIASALCLEGQEENLVTGLKALRKALEVQILPDGGHFQRCPSMQAKILAQLLEIKAMLVSAHEMVPENLQQSIDRMTPLLKAFRHGDGKLSLFNGGSEENAEWMDQVIALADISGKPINEAPFSGFQRMRAGRTVIIADSGAPGKGIPTTTTHYGPLSFELSVGKRRMVVNCGAHPESDSDWHEALRSTAAHSTLMIDDQDALVMAPSVTAERTEEEGHQLLNMRHDGYVKKFGVFHQRELYLSPQGDDVRGEDDLLPENPGGLRRSASGVDPQFKISFHLHPEVQALVSGDGNGVLLRLPHTSGGWRFYASGGEIALRESIYHGAATELRRSEQIIISGPLTREGAKVKWAFRRETG